MKRKWKLAAAAVVACAAVVSAHLPSPYDARFAIDRERERLGNLQTATRGALRAQSAAEWDAEKEYRGSYLTYQGDTVISGEWNGKPLHWWAKFYAKGDKPGDPGTGGGTSPWVLINSDSYGKNYVWQGYGPNGSISNGQARVATWRNGAEGAYSFTHDDIGSMPLGQSIAPGYELAQETGFEEIKQSWGVFVKMMDENEWKYAIGMVKDGHEMFNHSWDHTSAADQYQWFYNKGTIPDFDPSIPYAIRGLTVKSLWGNPQWGAPWYKDSWQTPGVPPNSENKNVSDIGVKVGTDCASKENPTESADPIRKLVLENDDIKIEGAAFWTGLAFSSDPCFQKKIPLVVTPKGSTEKIKLPSGMDVYVKYNSGGKANIAGLAEDGSAQGIINSGILYATTPAWHDLNQLDLYGENGWSGSTVFSPSFEVAGLGVANDGGAPALIASIFTVKAWEPSDITRNMKDANDKINQEIYKKIQNPGKYFAVEKRSEYYGYPMDAYSTASNLKLKEYGILQARAGSKTPQVMKGDFFHPYAIDFDAFYIEKSDWNPSKQGAGYVYPDNAHIWLGLNQMVDSIIYHKGYMIREFHAVADIPDGQWASPGSNPSFWALNSSAEGKGGWWGGITRDQLRVHYNYVKDRINDGRLVVYTASEAVKYRLTGNATSNPNLSKDGNDYKLTVTFDASKGGMHSSQIDEISVIVGIDAASSLDVQYSNGSRPRLAPKKLNGDGSAWSVNFNPQTAGSAGVKLIRNGNFVEPEWDGPTDFGDKDASGGPGSGNYPCDVLAGLIPECPLSISKTVKNRTSAFSFTGIQNGQINLRLTAGNYTAQLYNMQGRIVGTANINAVNGVNATGLRTDNLAKGIFVLNVKDAKGAAVLQHKLMLK
ncbi:MAG: hypothetical protein FWF51_00015 [Chitinivibrionia bacterium]|nr:hypothetical protein [Chitinivibrionia bacterium]